MKPREQAMPNLSRKGWAFAVELDDAVKETPHFDELLASNPLVAPDRPAMYVGYCHDWPPHKYPDNDFSEVKNSVLREHGQELQEERTGSSRSNLLALLRDAEDLVHELRGLGHVVFSVGRLFSPVQQRKYSVYVLKLPDAAKQDAGVQSQVREHEPDEAMPSVYVGQTSRPPEERLEQHTQGGSKANRFVARYGAELVPALYQHLNPLTQLESLRQERNLARRLRRAGYWVLSH